MRGWTAEACTTLSSHSRQTPFLAETGMGICAMRMCTRFGAELSLFAPSVLGGIARDRRRRHGMQDPIFKTARILHRGFEQGLAMMSEGSDNFGSRSLSELYLGTSE